MKKYSLFFFALSTFIASGYAYAGQQALVQMASPSISNTSQQVYRVSQAVPKKRRFVSDRKQVQHSSTLYSSLDACKNSGCPESHCLQTCHGWQCASE